MNSGRQRLLDAASRLLSEHPTREPSTRELYEAAGVAAPTLYHHFGTKEGLLDAVVEEAFARYLTGKRQMIRTGDLLADFSAGWDLHVQFGVEHPVLYALMYGNGPSAAATAADVELRNGLARLEDAGLLRVSIDEAAALTTAMAIGCVTQLNREGGTAAAPLAQAMRATLLAEITGQPRAAITPSQAARTLLAQLGAPHEKFTPAEQALFKQWLQTFATDEELQQVKPAPVPPSSKRKNR